MARKPDTPCSLCRKPMWTGRGSRPAETRMCRPCRRAQRQAPCTACGQDFDAWSGGHRRLTCSPACERAARIVGLAKARQAPRPPRECEDCLVPVDTTGVVPLCGQCGPIRKTLRDRDHWRRKNHRRRMVLGQVASEPYTLAEIAGRDGFCCQLCDLPVDMALAWPDRWSATIDHRVPLVAGGDDTRANVQLAHFVCNSRRGAALLELAV